MLYFPFPSNGSLSFFISQVIAEHLSVEEVAGIKEAFAMMDTCKRGKINIDELRIGLQKLGQQIPDADLQILMEAVSTILCHLAIDPLCHLKIIRLSWTFFLFWPLLFEIYSYLVIISKKGMQN